MQSHLTKLPYITMKTEHMEVFSVYRDNGCGGCNVTMFNTKEEALNSLEKYDENTGKDRPLNEVERMDVLNGAIPEIGWVSRHILTVAKVDGKTKLAEANEFRFGQ